MPQPPSTPGHPFRRLLKRRRGMALLLVMIGMVVCTILTAGFLSTQGTAIGIARNERDAAKCHALAQSGIDMCFWLIKNKPDWRTTMTPGTWLNNAAIGDGTASVTVADDTGSFTDDNTQPVTLTSTAAYDNRSFTLTATIRPTGGGTVFNSGNFIAGDISVGNGNLITAATVDSYNSAIASYNSLFPGANASFVSNTVQDHSLLLYFPSIFRGSYTAGPSGVMSSIIKRNGPVAGPAATATETETRNPGTVIFPNTAGLVPQSSINSTNLASPVKLEKSGIYDAITASGAFINITASGLYYVKHNLTIGSSLNSCLTVADNVSAAIVVHDNVNFTGGKIQLLGPNAQLAIYAMGNVTINGNLNVGGDTSRVIIFGDSGGGNIQITGSRGIMYGAIYAPQHDLTLQTNFPVLYGAVVANSLTVKDSAALHFDEALRSLRIDNITGGSAPTGYADYLVTITGGPGIPH